MKNPSAWDGQGFFVDFSDQQTAPDGIFIGALIITWVARPVKKSLCIQASSLVFL
jgi:hypothetical protein